MGHWKDSTLGLCGTHPDPVVFLCRELELPLVSGPVEGESFHLSEPEFLLMWPPHHHPSPLIHLWLFISFLVFHTHLFLPPLLQVQRTLGWLRQPAFGSSKLRWQLCLPLAPGPQGEPSSTLPQGAPVGQLLTALREVHLLCLPWAPALGSQGSNSPR